MVFSTFMYLNLICLPLLGNLDTCMIISSNFNPSIGFQLRRIVILIKNDNYDNSFCTNNVEIIKLIAERFY